MSNSNENGFISWRPDENWLKTLVRSKSKLRNDEIERWLNKLLLLCRINGGEYMFVDTANYWCNLASDEALGRLNVIVDIINATVNLSASTRQFYKPIVKRCNANIGKPLPTSVCIGTERLEIEIGNDPNTIVFQTCRQLINTVPSSDEIVGTVCIMPVDIDIIPEIYTFPGQGNILHILMRLFPDLRTYTTILWCIGNCLVDPVYRPKCLMLCGPGGSGKSTLLQQVYSCLLGCCGVLRDGSLVGAEKSMSDEISLVVASYRMALCYDMGMDKHPLNMPIYKNISGSDYVRVGHASIKTNCSLMLATNGLVDIDAQPGYLEDSILRRTVSVLMNVNAIDIPNDSIPEDLGSRLDFCCAAIYIRLQYEHMPISPLDLLLTLCQSKIDEVLEHVEESTLEPNLIEAVQAVDIISVILEMSSRELLFKARLVSPMCVVTYNNYSFLRGLKSRSLS